MAAAKAGPRRARHPTPFLTWLTPGLLNHAVGAQTWTRHPPWQPPPSSGATVLVFSFLTDVVKTCDSPWQAGPEEAGCARSCPAVLLQDQHPHDHTATSSRCHQSWGPGSGVLGRGPGCASPVLCSKGRQESRPCLWAWWPCAPTAPEVASAPALTISYRAWSTPGLWL